ncbi:MAG TPA: hypothetical protein VEL76_16300, partial [Gemmataceae bacterium]|nr:hypothetical protein [Gemmataceae bacterium]
MGDADERIAARPPAASTTPPEFLPMPVGSCVPNWGGARLGLRLIHVGLLFCYFGALLVPVVMLFPLLGEGRGVRTPAMNPVALFLCGGLLLLVPGGLILTGEAMLWTAPEECGARRWAVAAFLLGMVGKLLLGVAICGLWLTLSHPGPVPLG